MPSPLTDKEREERVDRLHTATSASHFYLNIKLVNKSNWNLGIPELLHDPTEKHFTYHCYFANFSLDAMAICSWESREQNCGKDVTLCSLPITVTLAHTCFPFLSSAFLLVCNATIPHALEKAHVSIHTPYLGRAGWWERIGRWTKLMWKAGKNVAVPSKVANLCMLVRNSMKSDQSIKECKYTLKSIIKIHHASFLDLGSYSITFLVTEPLH